MEWFEFSLWFILNEVDFLSVFYFILFLFYFTLFFLPLWAVPTAHGSSQAKGGISAAAAASQCHSHSNTGPLTHWVRPGIEPASSWILVRFVNCWATKGTPRVYFKVSKLFHVCLSVFFFFFHFLKFYWSRVDLQCCDNFCYTTKWFSYTYTHIHSFSGSFPL